MPLVPLFSLFMYPGGVYKYMLSSSLNFTLTFNKGGDLLHFALLNNALKVILDYGSGIFGIKS